MGNGWLKRTPQAESFYKKTTRHHPTFAANRHEIEHLEAPTPDRLLRQAAGIVLGYVQDKAIVEVSGRPPHENVVTDDSGVCGASYGSNLTEVVVLRVKRTKTNCEQLSWAPRSGRPLSDTFKSTCVRIEAHCLPREEPTAATVRSVDADDMWRGLEIHLACLGLGGLTEALPLLLALDKLRPCLVPFPSSDPEGVNW